MKPIKPYCDESPQGYYYCCGNCGQFLGYLNHAVSKCPKCGAENEIKENEK